MRIYCISPIEDLGLLFRDGDELMRGGFEMEGEERRRREKSKRDGSW
jgi:hypothetical protein